MEIYKGIAILAEDNCICKWIKESGRLDHDQNLLPRVLPHIPVGGTVIDAGGFVGDHTIAYAKQVGKEGNVFAFEPNPEAFKCLDYNLSKFQNTKCFNAGLSETISNVSLEVVPDNVGMTYMKEGGEMQTLTIDSIQFERLDFIKIDVEGYELGVLKGGEKAIRKFRPKMLIEINDYTLERAGITRVHIYSYLDSIGYSYENIYPEQSIDEYQMDIICLPK
jgi:FkbM family methyltransferase